MKKRVFLLLFSVVIIGCDNFSLDGELYRETKVEYKVTAMSSFNTDAKVTTGLLESGYFKLEDTKDINQLPFKSSYFETINLAANAGLIFKDNSDKSSFKSYKITLQISQNSALIKAEDFTIDYAGKEVSVNVFIN
ncbi:MAG: hypothetical protein HWD85_01950 [Flavobacteriaceae bacterium]|nr:hypothetical protein [Flavobacteriaceae bacterium]